MNALIDQTFENTFFNYITMHPFVLSSLFSIVIAFFIFSSYLGTSEIDSTKSIEMTIIQVVLFGMLLLLIVLNSSKIFLDIDVSTLINGLFSKNPTIDIIINSDKKLPTIKKEPSKEVFHISHNKYNYKDSKAICAAYGGKLATLNDINKAYDAGASWCSYGWSDDQMILYPTQQTTLDKLKTIKGYENGCGRLGVNGGYNHDVDKKYGINCYGVKPKITNLDLDYLDRVTLYPKSKDDKEMQDNIAFWKSKMSQLQVTPFNNNKWSE
jgi:hypothetical protein